MYSGFLLASSFGRDSFLSGALALLGEVIVLFLSLFNNATTHLCSLVSILNP